MGDPTEANCGGKGVTENVCLSRRGANSTTTSPGGADYDAGRLTSDWRAALEPPRIELAFCFRPPSPAVLVVLAVAAIVVVASSNNQPASD